MQHTEVNKLITGDSVLQFSRLHNPRPVMPAAELALHALN